MKVPIPRSLRWQIVSVLVAIVSIAIAMSWMLAVRFTARDFETLVTTEEQEQISEYARLIEVQYNISGTLAAPQQGLETNDHESSEQENQERRTYLETTSQDSEWNSTIARELGLSDEEVNQALTASSPATLADDLGSSAGELIAAIMQQEKQSQLTQQGYGTDVVLELAGVLEAATAYVTGGHEGSSEEGANQTNDLGSPLLDEAAILVVDVEGRVLFDGSSGSSASMNYSHEASNGTGIPIQDWRTANTVGYVLPTREAGDYNAQEAAFLNSTRDGLLIGGLSAAAVALIVGVLIAHRISRPVLALRNSAVRLASGESIARLPITTGELGAMSSAFNSMADSLDQQQEIRRRMVSDLSHELNTPLAVIQLEVEAWQDGIRTADEAAKHVLSELNLLRNLAADVELIAENDVGLLSIRKEPVNLSEFLPATADRWRIHAEAEGIHLQVDIPQHAVIIEADPDRLNQAVGNLVRNALQHTKQGGVVTITGENTYVEHLGGTRNLICVSDSGVGIEPKDISRVFERSVQTSSNRTGRGLGLTIVQKIVDAHEGTVWATSTPGQGSSFCIALP